MAILNIDVSACRTHLQLAAALKVPLAALNLVTLASTTCRRDRCPLSAVNSNHGYCVLCSQTWFPRKIDESGNPTTYCRGHGLYGPEYQRRPAAGHSTTCCCSSPLCEAIGYSNSGMFRFPSDEDHCVEAARVLGLPSNVRQKIAENRLSYKIAPWHYHANH